MLNALALLDYFSVQVINSRGTSDAVKFIMRVTVFQLIPVSSLPSQESECERDE